MATASILYHIHGLSGYKVLRIDFQNGEVFYHVKRNPQKQRCRYCNARWHRLVQNGTFTRQFHTLPTGLKKQWIILHGHELYCKECQKTYREPIPFAEGRSRYTKRFARYTIELCKVMTISDVASHLCVGWDLVKDLHKSYLRKHFKTRPLSKVRYIAIDEFATHKGHKYMTIVLDLETGMILHAHKGKGAESLQPFFKRLNYSKARIKSISIDMSPAFISAIENFFKGKVDIIHDPFHVVNMVNKALDETRRDLYRQVYGEKRNAIKGMRFVLLKGLEKLNANSLERMMELMELNKPLYQAYLLKEDLRAFWNLPNRKLGEQFLDSWIQQAKQTGLSHFGKLAKSINRHRKRLLTYFEHRISSGPLEGLNNKIKVLKRKAYGYRDDEYFKLRLYSLHLSKFKLV